MGHQHSKQKTKTKCTLQRLGGHDYFLCSAHSQHLKNVIKTGSIMQYNALCAKCGIHFESVHLSTHLCHRCSQSDLCAACSP